MRARGAEKRRRGGAHPSFPDRENFGRTAMQLPPETVYAQTLYQIGALAAIVRAQGGELQHVKPHGMLYNQAAKDPPLADAIAKAVRDVDAALVLVGLAGSELIRAGQHYQLTTRQEVFADRGYLADGSLVPRTAGRADRERRAGAGANPGNGAAIGCAASPANGRMLWRKPSACTATASTRWILRAACARRLPGAISGQRGSRRIKQYYQAITTLTTLTTTGRYYGRGDISLAADRHCRDCGRICFAF
jgi:hypothetical protein